jgi:hypothetical protein
MQYKGQSKPLSNFHKMGVTFDKDISGSSYGCL